MQQQSSSRRPVGFRCSDGTYKLSPTTAVPRPSLSSDELAEVAPTPCRLSFCSIAAPSGPTPPSFPASSSSSSLSLSSQRKPAARNDTVLLALNCRRSLHVCRDFEIVKQYTYDRKNSSFPTAHAFNHMTRSPDSTQLACCYSSGAVAVVDVMSGSVLWINFKVCVCLCTCLCVCLCLCLCLSGVSVSVSVSLSPLPLSLCLCLCLCLSGVSVSVFVCGHPCAVSLPFCCGSRFWYCCCEKSPTAPSFVYF